LDFKYRGPRIDALIVSFLNLGVKKECGETQTQAEEQKMKRMRIVILMTALALVASTGFGQEPPTFYTDTYPEHALKSRLDAEDALKGKGSKLDAKTRELIALGVSAQIPCIYCVYAHDKNARAAGASEAEIREAVATAAHVRHWSTVLNGMAYDFDKFKAEVDKMHATE
jgi:AhpD family alkylhydroperoxidase